MKKLLVFLISYGVMFAIIALIVHLASAMGSSAVAIVVLTILAIFGWRFINFITPSLFIWMPLAGWVIYFIVKFIVSAFLGMFVIPYHVAKMIMDEKT